MQYISLHINTNIILSIYYVFFHIQNYFSIVLARAGRLKAPWTVKDLSLSM